MQQCFYQQSQLEASHVKTSGKAIVLSWTSSRLMAAPACFCMIFWLWLPLSYPRKTLFFRVFVVPFFSEPFATPSLPGYIAMSRWHLTAITIVGITVLNLLLATFFCGNFPLCAKAIIIACFPCWCPTGHCAKTAINSGFCNTNCSYSAPASQNKTAMIQRPSSAHRLFCDCWSRICQCGLKRQRT